MGDSIRSAIIDLVEDHGTKNCFAEATGLLCQTHHSPHRLPDQKLSQLGRCFHLTQQHRP